MLMWVLPDRLAVFELRMAHETLQLLDVHGLVGGLHWLLVKVLLRVEHQGLVVVADYLEVGAGAFVGDMPLWGAGVV